MADINIIWSTLVVLSCIAPLSNSRTAEHSDQRPAFIEDSCGKTIKIKYSQSVSLSEDVFYKSGWNCETTMEVEQQHQLRIEFQTFNVGHSTVMYCTDVLRVYDGANPNAPELSPTKGLCGRFLPNPIQSTGNKLTLKFKSRVLTTSTGFTFIATKIRKDMNNKCKTSEFKCDGDYCIDKVLLCDGYSNCLDSSDESKQYAGCQGLFATWTDFSTEGKIAVTVTVITVVFILFWMFTTVGSCLYFKRYNKRLQD